MAQRSKIGTHFFCVFLLLFFIGVWKIDAHPMPNTLVKLHVLESEIEGEAFVPLVELESALGEKKDSLHHLPFLKKYFLAHIKATTGQHAWQVQIGDIRFDTSVDKFTGKYQEVVFRFRLFPPQKNYLRNFSLQYDVVIHQVITHAVWIWLVHDWHNGMVEENSVQELGTIQYDVVKGKIFPLSIQLDTGSKWIGFFAMVRMGMNHIKKGTDHLLFIITLLLPAFLLMEKNKWTIYGGVKQGLYKTIKLISAFTLGHTITLIVGTYQLFAIPSTYIEISVALSIFISAIHCITPIFYNREIVVATLFGFIHGAAFSQTLHVFDLSKMDFAISLAGFNIGIEIMQLLVLLMAVPWVLMGSRTIFFKPIKNGIALFVCVASIGWMVQQINQTPNRVSKTVEALFTNSSWLFAGVAIIALILFTLDKKIKRNYQG